MNVRASRGMEISATLQITCQDNVWLVPSQSSVRQYTVDLNATPPRCSCPDYASHGLKCKHIFAVEYTIRRESGETLPDTPKPVSRTYRQAWPAYNTSQCMEKAKFKMLLYELCQGIEAPVQTCGRRRLPLSDMIFCAAFKVYSTISGRRLMSDLREANESGYISRVPHYNSIFNYLEASDLMPYLLAMITRSSLPLKAVETRFAVDSSGLSTGRFMRWISVRHKEHEKHGWLKVHLMCGVKTNIVTSVEITSGFAGDSPYFVPLVRATAQNFNITEVSVDKAYSSWENLRVVEKQNAVHYIPFKETATDKHKNSPPIWKQMYHLYCFHQEEFMEHYHRRSNVESTFSMIKARFGERLWSRTRAAQVNEALLKVLCHNICCVVQSMYELGVKPDFWASESLAQKRG
jgi:transposase